ncbi:MAG TPA: hypothetical protein VFU69_13940, partial [Ktedonobacterales bacterium]|nr:hypothetical protein [Ktedonobacterales bacterium]
ELVFDLSRVHLFDPTDEQCLTSRPPEAARPLEVRSTPVSAEAEEVVVVTEADESSTRTEDA